MYSYGWREYMPDLGRWNGIDQLAETYHSISPYTYVANNPVSNTDPDGRWIYEDGSIGETPATWDFTNSNIKNYKSDFLGINQNDGSGGSGITMGDILDMFQGQDPITTLNYIFQFGEWDYIYTEKKGMLKGTQGAEFLSESMLESNPYNNKFFNTADFKKVNNMIASLNIAITVIKLKNGEYSISTSKKPIAYDSSAYDATSDGSTDIQYIGNGKGVLTIQFQITNKEQAIGFKVDTKVGTIDGSVNVKDSHTANLTVSYPFKISENRGKTSLQFGRPTNYQSYNLNTLMIAEGIRYVPLIKYELIGPPIQTRDYNYQIKKK